MLGTADAGESTVIYIVASQHASHKPGCGGLWYRLDKVGGLERQRVTKIWAMLIVSRGVARHVKLCITAGAPSRHTQ